jgi:hypothetical protein
MLASVTISRLGTSGVGEWAVERRRRRRKGRKVERASTARYAREVVRRML